MTCSKEQQQIIMLPAKRRKGPTLWSPQFCARFWRKCPRAAGTHSPIPKLQAWCFWSYLLLSCPSPLSSPLLIHPFNTIFFCLFSYFKLSPSVSQCAYPTTRLHCLLHLGLISELQFLSSTDLFHTPDLLSCILLFVPCQFQFLSSDKTSCNLRSFPSYNFQYDMSNFWTYQHTEEWLESSSDPYSKLNLSPMLAPSKAFFLFALLGLIQRPPHNTVPEGRCQRHPKESKALHSRDMSLNTRQAGAQFSVLKLNPVPLLKQFR